MNILYVEDNPSDVDLTQRALKKLAPHFTLEVVGSCAAALDRLDRLSQHAYDIVLCDLRLPDGDGISILSYIRQHKLPLAVVILTSTGDEETAVAALKAGADDYLGKRPGYPSQLPGVLENALQRYRTETAAHSQSLLVLYAEHSMDDVDLTRRHFSNHAPHIQVEPIFSGQEVFQRLAKDPGKYQVLLTDYRLPGMSALDVIKDLRQNGYDLPVVVVTGQGTEETALQVIRMGASDYLIKNPGYLFQLPGSLENAYHRAQLAREHAALVDSEKRFRLLAEHAQDLIYRYRLTPPVGFEYISPSATAITGFTPEELCADAALGLRMVHRDDRQLLKALMNGDPTAIHEPAILRWTRKDGRMIYTEQRNTPIMDESGRVVALEGIARDITERKAAEEHTYRQYALLQSILESTPGAVFSVDLEYRYTSYNTMHATIMKVVYGAEIEVGKSFLDYQQNPSDRIEAKRNLDRALQGEFFTDEVYSGETSRTRMFFEISHSPIRTQAGEIIGVSVFSRDVTARRRSEEQMRLLTAGLQAAANGIVITDRQGSIIWSNPAFSDLTGYTQEEAAGKNPRFLRSGVQELDFYQQMWATIQSGKVWRGELTNQRKDGSLYPEDMTITPLLDAEGDITHFIAVKQDITERKRAEEHLRRSEERYRRIVSTATEGIWMVDENRITTFANARMAELLGCTIDEMTGQTVDQFLFPEDVARQLERFKQRSTGTPGYYELRMRQTDGDELWCLVSATPLIDENKQFRGSLAMYTDITARRRAEDERNRLYQALEHSHVELTEGYDQTIEGWSRALEYRDRETKGHSTRVTDMTLKLAVQFGIPAAEMVNLRRGALLHDIGKMAIPDIILHKPGPLTAEEWEIMRQHPTYSFQMLSPIHFLEQALDIPHFHHERYNGSGYPEGRKGEEIPLSARIFAVVDVWDALSSDRPYRPAWDELKVQNYLMEEAGKQFDPQVVDAFLKLLG